MDRGQQDEISQKNKKKNNVCNYLCYISGHSVWLKGGNEGRIGPTEEHPLISTSR